MNLERRLRENDENEALRRDETLLLQLLVSCAPVRKGRTWVCSCPVHAEKTPSCYVRQGKDGAWRWRCFGCGQSGDVLDLVMRKERVSFREARRLLGVRAVAPVSPALQMPRKPLVVACEVSGCGAIAGGVDGNGRPWGLDWIDVACALQRGRLLGGLIAQMPGERPEWLCPGCERRAPVTEGMTIRDHI